MLIISSLLFLWLVLVIVICSVLATYLLKFSLDDSYCEVYVLGCCILFYFENYVGLYSSIKFSYINWII